MFAHTCSACERRQLVFPSQIKALHNTDHGIVVSFTCWCGAEQLLLTGRKATEQRDHAAAAAA
jgi:hypothetical protein